MTFCIGIKVLDGLVGISDTRIISGYESVTAKKVSIYQGERHAMFLMTSGLRSVRDKAVTYFEEMLLERDEPFDKLFKVANAFADQVRRVAREDRKYLSKNNFSFDIHSLVGGQMSEDRGHHLYHLYPEGNWVEVFEGTPYQILGASGYGKPVIDRTLKYEDPLRFALKVGILSFDSTRISTTDVDFPIDVVLYQKNSFHILEHRYNAKEIQPISSWWMDRLRSTVKDFPIERVEEVMSKLTIDRYPKE